MKRPLVWILATALTVAACALPSVEDYVGRPVPDGGSSSSSSGSNVLDASNEGGPPVVTGDAGEAGALDDGGAGVLLATDFEDGTCGPASFWQGSGGSSNNGHESSKACQVCRTNESIDYYTWNSFTLVRSPVIGQKYHARAWVRRGEGSFKEQTVFMVLRVLGENPRKILDENEGDPVTIVDGDTWRLLEVSFEVKQAADVLDAFVASATLTTAGERCIIVDDVRVWRE